ncbi:hypothetical protein BGX26_008260 [Mortierella sp. AD094]|nr:hypothetical protein BGX26_008260 [Mortierella sp. AD094]
MFRRLFNLDGGSSKKSKRLTIYIEPPVQQGYNHNFNDKVQPLIVVRGTREKPGMVEATVTLELDMACEGDEVEIQFRAVIGSKISVKGGGFSVSLSEQVLQRKRWILPVTKLGPHVIAAGTYSRQVCTIIEPNWPSSCTEHSEGFVQYSIHAQITRMSVTKVAMPILTATQEFLVLNLNNSCENYSNYNNYNQCNNFSKFNFHGKENYSNSNISNISYITRNKHNYSNSCLSNISYSNLNRQNFSNLNNMNFSNSCLSNVSYNSHNKQNFGNSCLSNVSYNNHNKHNYTNSGMSNINYNNHNKHSNYSNSINSNASYSIRTKHSFFMLPNSTVGALPATSTPHSVSVLSPKKSVPIEMAIPSETLVFGQRVPITIVVNPFNEWTPFAGQEIVVMEARFGIEQTRHARSANRIIKDKIVKDFAEIHVPSTCMGSWPQIGFQIVHPAPAPDAGEPPAEYHPIAAFSFECDEFPLIFDQMDPRQEKKLSTFNVK